MLSSNSSKDNSYKLLTTSILTHWGSTLFFRIRFIAFCARLLIPFSKFVVTTLKTRARIDGLPIDRDSMYLYSFQVFVFSKVPLSTSLLKYFRNCSLTFFIYPRSV